MPLKIYKRGDVWHYRGSVAGRRLRGSTGTADKITAGRIAAEREAKAWKGRLDGPAAILSFAQAAMLYRKAGKSVRFLDLIEDYWKDTLVKEITAGAVRKSALALMPSVGPATRNRQVIVPTQAIINHAAESDLCPHIRVKRFQITKKEKEPADWAWVQKFMAHANPHLGALACFMFLTGARISEALALTWDDLDLTKRRALIKQTKIGAERWAHLPEPLLISIANIVGEREGKVFKYSTRSTCKPQWAKVPKRAKIKNLTPHACRHGFATSMLQAGVDPITTAKRGGWKSPAHLFATYGHAMDDETITDRIIDTPATQRLAADVKRRDASNG